ncbi:MAG: hypothetical protein ABR583_01825, partial [Gaiellaceae bacterium]
DALRELTLDALDESVDDLRLELGAQLRACGERRRGFLSVTSGSRLMARDSACRRLAGQQKHLL